MPRLPDLTVPLTDGPVVLREWGEADVDAMISPLNEAEIARWTRVPSPYTRADANDYLARMAALRRSDSELSVAIASASTDELLGSMSIRVPSWENLRGELGYLVFAHARGRGVATRAVRLLSGFAFERIGLRRVEILAAVENVASQRVAENAGFTREGILRSYMDNKGRRQDMVSWSLLPDELRD